MTQRLAGFSTIIVATGIAGIAAYLVTFIVYRVAGPADYALFAVFWATLYLLIGGLSGIQQEVTRATHAIEPGQRATASKARNFGAVAAALVFSAILATAPLWVDTVFAEAGWSLVFPLAVGVASYVLVAVLAGSLYGLKRWRSVALMIAVDPILRLALLMIALIFTHDIIALAWIAALPFPLTLAVLWPVVRRGFVGRTELDVGYRALTWNSTRAVLASVATAVMVTGFPLLLGVTSDGVSNAMLGELIFTITLTRAPLIVTAMSLQSFFVVRFRDHPATWWRTFVRIELVVLGVSLLLGLLGLLLGPAAFGFVSGRPVTMSGELIAVLAFSSGLVGAMCVSGPAVLARSRHLIYSLGWAAAATATVVVMLLPIEFLARVQLALLAGPIIGLAVHLTWLASQRHAPVAAVPTETDTQG
ncbi:O-antigen/teichoic acid export membrane protein [Salinibacterium sp. CAN_S4]|uniref:hypothetical protein n=1 Tax=Salinibacterium sp. CAN_S4 TaxID=2787727 RepID=UPI0018F00480